jgi:hypothetical protein
MERLRSLTRRAGVVAPALLAVYLVGCSSAPPVDLVSDAFKQAAALDKPEPASQVICFWQRRLSSLPDPARPGAQTQGVAGQMFLITPSNAAAEVNGDLTVVVHDETPRPPGQSHMLPEKWHYTRETLQRLVTTDERFGRSYVLFLPWPEHWLGNVTAVKVAARYSSPGNPDIFAGEVRMALDFSAGGPVWSEVATSDARSVPDPARMLQQARAAAVAHPVPPSTPAPTNWPPPAVPSVPAPVISPAGASPPPIIAPRVVP